MMRAKQPERRLITMQDLRDAKVAGVWTIDKASEFYMHRRPGTDDLKRPAVVLKAGTVVEVVKVYRCGQAALLRYEDRTGKVWWSWTHANARENVE